MLSLFVMLTLEDFPQYMDAGMEIHEWSWIFFVSFILVAAFVVINVFIGIVLNSLEEARSSSGARRSPRRGGAGAGADADPALGARRARAGAEGTAAQVAPIRPALLLSRGGERRMCHHMTWEEWQLLQDERREDIEPRTIEVRADSEPDVEPEPEREPERELIRV